MTAAQRGTGQGTERGQPRCPIHKEHTGQPDRASPVRYSPKEAGRLGGAVPGCVTQGILGALPGNSIYFRSAGPRTGSRGLGSAEHRLGTVPRLAGAGTERE